MRQICIWGGTYTEYISAYIAHEKKIATVKTAVRLFALSFIFSVLNAAVCYILKESILFIAQFILCVAALAFIVASIVRKADPKVAILCNAVQFTYLSVVFILFSYLSLLSAVPASPAFLLYAILMYLACSAAILFIMLRRIKSGKFMHASGIAAPTAASGICGGAVGGIMLNVFAAGASYETIVAVAVILSLAVSAFFSAGSHLYLCFYYCIKYRL